jgi:hypothetical protein
MAIETFLEAAQLLYPHLIPQSVRRVEYLDIFEVPGNLPREARIVCRRLQERGGESVCQVAISGQEITATGRLLNKWTTYYRGEVIMCASPSRVSPGPGFPLRSEELVTSPIPRARLLDWYEQKGTLKGRYRVLEGVNGTGPGVVSGVMIAGEEDDFAGWPTPQYRYSPYALEGLMHLPVPYFMLQDFETRNIIPSGLGEVQFVRRCRPGERLTLEARLKKKDEVGTAWDACVWDEAGQLVLQAQDISFHWFETP